MSNLHSSNKILRELGAMVGLQVLEEKRSFLLRSLHKEQRATRSSFTKRFGISPPRVHIEKSKDVDPCIFVDPKVDRIDLY